jgi:chemotaxis methyl-accepting protein methylase
VIRVEDIKFDEDRYDILTRFLRKTTGIDLNYYQRRHVEQRIKSRMIWVNCETLESYHEYIRKSPSEIQKFSSSFNIN